MQLRRQELGLPERSQRHSERSARRKRVHRFRTCTWCSCEMRSRMAVVSSGVVLIVLAGFSHGQPPGATAARVAPKQWKALIRDSYDGEVNGHYSCSVARAAITHVPHSKIRCRPCAALRAYERRVC